MLSNEEIIKVVESNGALKHQIEKLKDEIQGLRHQYKSAIGTLAEWVEKSEDLAEKNATLSSINQALQEKYDEYLELKKETVEK